MLQAPAQELLWVWKSSSNTKSLVALAPSEMAFTVTSLFFNHGATATPDLSIGVKGRDVTRVTLILFPNRPP